MGPYRPDPACGGVPAWNLLQGAYGSSVSARSTDRPATTQGQKRAMSIVESSGVVLPQTALDSDTATIKSAIRAQLLATAAGKQGIATPDPEFVDFVASGHGKAINALVADVADGDLRFALNRSLTNFRVLTSTTADVDVSNTHPGLRLASMSSELAALDGTAFVDGFPKEDLQGDIVALAAGVMTASQCAVSEQNMLADSDSTTMFQNAFLLGQSFYQRLVILREDAPANSEAWKVANAAAAEVRAWAGQGRIMVMPQSDGSPWDDPPGDTLETIGVALAGLDPRLLEVGGEFRPWDQIAIVYGPSWVADCAAKVRTSCPDDFERDYVVRTTEANVELNHGFGVRESGFDGDKLPMMWFPVPPKPGFNPAVVGRTTSDEHLYVIARSDPDRPSRGKVLAAFDMREWFGLTSASVSPNLEKLISNAIGIGKFAISGFGNGASSLSDSPSYCVEHVPRDMFVPLESELTSDSDQYENSWRHYLNLARNAAERADQLADKMIEIGLQRDLRREAAGEALAQLCGSYGSLDEIKVKKGEVIPPDDDEALRACLDEETIDVVFLTEDQVESGVASLRRVLGCHFDDPNEPLYTGEPLANLAASGLSDSPV